MSQGAVYPPLAQCNKNMPSPNPWPPTHPQYGAGLSFSGVRGEEGQVDTLSWMMYLIAWGLGFDGLRLEYKKRLVCPRTDFEGKTDSSCFFPPLIFLSLPNSPSAYSSCNKRAGRSTGNSPPGSISPISNTTQLEYSSVAKSGII